uniref:PDZ domain-containing protein n=1 Tax=Macrostomum lignano TaxID=282301 RepID=A0A1I8IGR9_9PLAT
MAVKPVPPPFSLPVDYVPANPKLPETSISQGELERLAVGGLRALDQRPPAAANGALGVIRCDSPPVALEEDDEIGPETSAPQEQPTPKIGPYGAEANRAWDSPSWSATSTTSWGIYVKHITDGGPAAEDGTLRTGDRLLQANEFELAEATYDEALDRLRSMTGVNHRWSKKLIRRQLRLPQRQRRRAAAAAATVKKEVRLATTKSDVID